MSLIGRMQSLMGGRMVRDIRGTMLIALLGRICHFFAFVYAARCLGDSLGESSEALGWAQYLQFILTLGLDIVAVRHLAAKSVSFEQLVPRIFTSRLVIYGVCSSCWILGLFFLQLPWLEFQLWLAAILNLMTLGMNFQWVFQGKERMPIFTMIQAMISFGILLGFVLFLKPGTQAGADLWVMGMCQLFVTTGSWIYIKMHYKVALYAKKWWRDIGVYILEGLPNWIFGLLYNTLITIGMLSLKKLSAGEGKFSNHDDAYATLYRLALAVHFILAFVGSVIYTRIVIWKNERSDFFFRVGLVCFGVISSGFVVCSIIHWVHPILYPFLFKKEVFLPAAPYMSWMLFGRFVGLTSGILVWGMLAHHRDWRAVQCALFPVVASVLLHFILVPQYGMTATVFLNLGGELGLLICCLIGFMGLRKSAGTSNQ